MDDMKESRQIEMFNDELDKLTARYSSEFDLTVASMVGVLQCQIHQLIQSAMISDDVEEDDEETV